MVKNLKVMFNQFEERVKKNLGFLICDASINISRLHCSLDAFLLFLINIEVT